MIVNGRAGRTWRRLSSAVWVGVFVSCSACTPAGDNAAQSSRRLRVFVSIPPQKYFLERIGGEHVDVSVLVPPGQSPHTYEPTSKQMVDLSAARAYFRIGLPFEERVVRKLGAVLEHLNILDTNEGIQLRSMRNVTDHADHSHHGHGEGCHHGEDELDPHVWMNPRLVKLQARTICRELSRLAPACREAFEGNLRSFETDLDRVDAKIAAALAPLRGRAFYVFHPSFGYFAEAYGLRQVAVEASGKEPTAKQLGALIAQAREDGVRLIFVQPQFATSSAEAIAEHIGGAVIPMDPLAEGYIDNLLDVAGKIEAALRGSAEGGP